NNKLAKWELYYESFSDNMYQVYCEIYKNNEVFELFNKSIRSKYICSTWANELFKPSMSKEEFKDLLKTNMKQVYISAKEQGYIEWNVEMYLER
ncbi:MAG: HNH endonuclease, partial [Bacilli bacterium]